MGSELRELYVRLRVDHGDTRSQMAQIKAELRAIDSAYRAAAAGAGQYASSTDKAQADINRLTQKLEVQRDAVIKAQAVMQDQAKKLDENRAAYEKYGQVLPMLKKGHEDIKGTIATVTAMMEAERAAAGESSDEYKRLSGRLAELNKQLADQEKNIKKVEGQHKALDKAIGRNTTALSNASIAVDRAKIGEIELTQELERAQKEYARLTQETDRAAFANLSLGRALDQTDAKLKQRVANLEAASAKMKKFGEHAKEVGDAQARAGGMLSAAVTAPMIAAGTYALKAANDWESAFTGVRKTVNGTAEDLKKIEDELLGMTKIPTSEYVLADIAANAGQLGIATENVVKFTRTIGDVQETTDLTAEAASQDFAQFSNITRMAQGDVDRMASSVVELGNNMAAKESAIVGMAMKLGSAGTQAGMTQPKILGIAASLASLGLEAEAGGTAFSKTIVGMQVAIETGSKDIKKYADVAGMTSKQFAAAWREDAAGALTSFVQGLSTGSKSAIVMLDEMGISETRMRDALLRASNASELFAGSIDMATRAWDENVALTREAELRYGTVESRMAALGKQVRAEFRSLGQDMVPYLEKGMGFVSTLTERFGALDEAQRANLLTWAGIVAAVGPAITLFGKFNSTVGNVSLALGKLTESAAAAGGGILGFGKGLMSMLGPGGYLLLGAAALWGLAEGFKAIEANALTVDNAVNKALGRLDPDHIKARTTSITNEVDAQTKLKVSTAIENTTTIESQLDAVYQPIIDALAAGKTVSAEDQAKVNTGVNKVVDDALAAVELDTDAKFAELNRQLKAGLIDEAEYKTRVDALVAQATEAKAGLDGVRTQSEALVADLTGKAGADAEGFTEKYNTMKTSAAGTVRYLNGLNDLIKVSSVFKTVADKLTDGKADSKAQTDQLLKDVEDTFGGLITDVNDAMSREIAKLDVNSDDYDAAVSDIKTKGADMVDELKGLQTAASQWISDMSGKSTSEVKARLGELEAIERRALEVTAAINAAVEADARQGSVAAQLVKKGKTRDTKTIDKALGGTNSQYELDMQDAERQGREAMEKLQEAYGKGLVSDKAYQEQEQEILASTEARKAALTEAYRQQMAEIFAGVAKAFPEFSEEVEGAVEKMDVADAIQKLIEKVNSGEVKREDVSDEVAAAMGLTGDELYTQIQQALMLGDPMLAVSQLATIAGQLRDKAAEVFNSTEFGVVGETFSGALESGILGAFNDLDLSDGETKLRAMIGDLGQKSGPIDIPMVVQPVITVAQPTEGGADAPEQVREQVEGQVEDSGEPVKTEVAVQPEPKVSASAEGGGLKAELKAEADRLIAGAAPDAVTLPLMVTLKAEITGAQASGKTIGQQVLDGMQEATGGAEAIGKAFGTGLNKGLEGTRATLRATARSIANEIRDTIKNAWQINSPSRVGEDLGENFGGGVNRGLAKTMPDLVGMAQRMSNVMSQMDIRQATTQAHYDQRDQRQSITAPVTIEKVEVRGDYDVDRLTRRMGARNRQLLMGMGER